MPKGYPSVLTVKVFKTESKNPYFELKFAVTFSVLSIHVSLNFGYLTLELHDVPIFQKKSGTSGNLSLYSTRRSLKLKGAALEMHLL